MNKGLDVCILNYNDYRTTKKLVNKIRKFQIINHIIIVDNHSTDNSYVELCLLKDDKVTVIQTPKNGGYGYGNNYGIMYAKKEHEASYILVCNPDVDIEEKTIAKMIYVMENDDKVAVVAPQMVDVNNKKVYTGAWSIPTANHYILSASIICNKFLHPNNYPKCYLEENDICKVDCVAGSLLMFRASVIENKGIYDENIFLYGEETLLGIKLKQMKYKTVLISDHSFIHIHGVSISKSIPSQIMQYRMILNSRMYILKKYYCISKMKLIGAKLFFLLAILERRLYYFIKK